jgi:hypothetical protein
MAAFAARFMTDRLLTLHAAPHYEAFDVPGQAQQKRKRRFFEKKRAKNFFKLGRSHRTEAGLKSRAKPRHASSAHPRLFRTTIRLTLAPSKVQLP